MADINPSIPGVGELNTTADPKIRTALNTIIATLNDIGEANLADGAISADKLSAGLAAMLGINQTGSNRRGRFRQASESNAITGTSFTDPSNGPDRVVDLVVPSGGIIWVYYRAIWRATNSGAVSSHGSAALFLESNQVKVPATSAPSANEMGLSSSGTTTATGDTVMGTDGNPSLYSGQPLSGQGASSSAATDYQVPADGANAAGLYFNHAKFIPIEVDAGTYDVGVKFKSVTNGSLYVKERTLLAWVQDFD